MAVAAAIVGGLGAAGSIGGALINSSASKSAASQQAAAQQAALAQQQSMFNTGQQAVNPFIQAGQSVLPELTALQNPGTANAALQATPGFNFASQYGTMAATNALSGKSGASAGPLATAVSQYNNGLASQNYFNTIQSLQGTAGIGSTSANNLLSGAINSGNSQAGTLGNIGNAQASGTLGSANALAGGLTGAAGAGSNALLYNQLLGQNGGGGLYSANALQNGPSNSAISNMTDAQASQYESMFG